MKNICAMLFGVLLFLSGARAFGQDPSRAVFATSVDPFRLPITYHKTTHLIFPHAIKSVDRGSGEVLVQKAWGVENILQVKAARPNFAETNLTVITADGRLYSFNLTYSDRPLSLTLRFVGSNNDFKPQALFSTAGTTDAAIQQRAAIISGKRRILSGLNDARHGIQFRLSGIYNQDDVLYFQIRLRNSSQINYDIDQLRFFIRDHKEVKRTASQELEVKPLYVHGHQNAIANLSEQVLVFAFPKFTIPDKKYLAIQLMEKNGGRHLKLKVPNRAIVKSKAAPPL